MAEIKEKNRYGNTIFYIDGNEIKEKTNMVLHFFI